MRRGRCAAQVDLNALSAQEGTPATDEESALQGVAAIKEAVGALRGEAAEHHPSVRCCSAAAGAPFDKCTASWPQGKGSDGLSLLKGHRFWTPEWTRAPTRVPYLRGAPMREPESRADLLLLRINTCQRGRAGGGGGG